MINKLILIPVLILFMMLWINYGYAKNIYIAPNIGLCKTIGNNSEHWRIGPSGGLDIFYKPLGIIPVGGRISYNREFPNGGLGHFSVIEIIPSTRIKVTQLVYTNPKSNEDVYLQLGVGIFLLDSYYKKSYSIKVPCGEEIQYYYDPDGNFFGTKTKTYYCNSVKTSSESYSGTRPGIQIGIAYIGKYLEICPLFSLIFTEKSQTMRLSVNAGFSLIK